MKYLLIDDIRMPGTCGIPEDAEVARTFSEGLEYICSFDYDVVYLDHDLGCFDETGKEHTGYDILCFLERAPMLLPKKIVLVTSNPVGRAKMEQVLRRLYG